MAKDLTLDTIRIDLEYIQACFSLEQIGKALYRIRTPLQDAQANFIYRGKRNKLAVIILKDEEVPTRYIAKRLGISEGRVNTIWLSELRRRRE